MVLLFKFTGFVIPVNYLFVTANDKRVKLAKQTFHSLFWLIKIFYLVLSLEIVCQVIEKKIFNVSFQD